jgi:hypothetical protein
MIVAIGAEVPGYRRPMEGPFGQALRMGVENALARFVDGIEAPVGEEDPNVRLIYVGLGMLEQSAGRSLDALLAAYRLGARLAWERFVAAGREAGHEPDVLYRLAAAIFTYIDRISAESIEGWTAEQAATEAERGRRRRALVRLLGSEDVGVDDVRDAAREAAWPRPATVAALVADDPDAERLAGRLGGDAIGAVEQALTIAFVPDPDAPGRRAQLATLLGRTRATLGPTVGLERAPHSLSRARAAHRLLEEGLVEGPLVVADEHLSTLLLLGEGTLATELADSALAPLADLRPGPAEKLTETLRAWLDHPGQVQHVAGLLHVHPQTVRYRLAQLRELFGDRLDDADARFELALALRAGYLRRPKQAT